jgi:predicted amino acid-binding ACT domain protein
MTLTEWLDRQIDIAAAKHDIDNSTVNVVNINQTFLRDLAQAVMFVDERLQSIEAALDLPKFELEAKGKRVTRLN